MYIKSINQSNVDAVAKLMSTIKPDWWDFAGASQQLQDVSLLANWLAGIWETLQPQRAGFCALNMRDIPI